MTEARRTSERSVARRQRVHCRHALTLIEVLLATVIGAMVVSTSAVVAVQAVSSQRTAQSAVQRAWRRDAVHRRFEQDLESRLRWLPESVGPVQVPAEPGSLLTILTLGDVADGTSLARVRMPVRVTWLVKGDPARNGHQWLYREVLDLTQANAEPRWQVLARDLSEVRVEARSPSGKDWSALRTSTQRDRSQRQAIRLVCRWAEPEEQRTTTVILRNLRRSEP